MGLPLKRREDKVLISGRGKYMDDLKLPGMLHAVILRSAYAHAKIKKVDLGKLTSNPNVVLALSGEEIRKISKPLPIVALPPDAKRTDVFMLAVEKVHYSGEPVAVVVATDRYSAEDALENIEVEYEPLEAIINVEQAIEPGAPRIYPEWEDNVGISFQIRAGNVEEAFKDADLIFQGKDFQTSSFSITHRNPRVYRKLRTHDRQTAVLCFYADATHFPQLVSKIHWNSRKQDSGNRTPRRRRVWSKSSHISRRAAGSTTFDSPRKTCQMDRDAK